MPADMDPFVELRMQTPRTVIDVIDAVSAARRMTRTELVLEVLSTFADERMREAQAVFRVNRLDAEKLER